MALLEPADAGRFAVFALTSGWQRLGDGPAWRTPAGAEVRLTEDGLLGRPVLECHVPDGDGPAAAEADELAAALPAAFGVARYEDVSAAYARAGTPAMAGRLLPLLAAVAGGGERTAAVRAEVDSGLHSDDPEVRAGAALATAYLDDDALARRRRTLASDDPDERVRRAAREAERGTGPAVPLTHLVRRLTFVPERVRDEVTAFAGAQGWARLDDRPAWRTPTGTDVVLVSDAQLDRDLLVLYAPRDAATPAEAAAALDATEALIRDRFDTVHLPEVLARLDGQPPVPVALTLLRVAAASAPTEYDPAFLRTIARVFGAPVTPLRGFAVGTSVYFPWPEVAPLLDWLAAADPEPAVRQVAAAARRTVAEVNGDRAVPAMTYRASGTDLVRRVHLPGGPLDERLGTDRLWHPAPAGGTPDYPEVGFDEAVRLATEEER